MYFQFVRNTFIWAICYLLSVNSLFAQSGTDIVNNYGAASAMHQANIGKIIFTDKAFQLPQLSEADFLQEYSLTNKSNLFVTVFIANSLTNYLHQLAPALTADSLSKVGNYQFLFYIDNKLVYQTNLLPGAPTPEQQKTQTVWTKPLINNQHEGAWWSQSAWNRFMFNGGDSTLTEGSHILRLELRPYVKVPQLKVGSIIAAGQLHLQVKRKPVINLANIKLSTIIPYDGFLVSTESFDRDKIKALKANIEADAFKHITSVIVIKNGKILVEEYFNGANRDSLHDVRSVGKSFASTLTGMALHDGYLKSVNQQLREFYDLKGYENNSTAKANTTIKELLTMSSRFDGDDDNATSPGNEENMYPTDNWVKFVLNLPMDTVNYVGQWHYFTAGVMLLGSTLNSLMPDGLDKYADTRLFKPLHIINYHWQYTPQNVVSTAGGIRMSALDFAKYGQLYKNGGSWNGKQLIDKAWVAETFTKHKAIPGRKDEYYGYLFWNKTYHSHNKAYEAFYCSGNGGNKIYVFKNKPLVVVITATAYGNGYAHRQADQMVEQYILPAVFN